jgi:ABC-type proline/glycine betaine transport system ATPase subunit
VTAALEFRAVDILFCAKAGRRSSATALEQALALLDAGGTRSEIAEKTGAVVGVANASLVVERGEISVLMGLSGSGKSTLLRAANGLNLVTRGQVLVRDGETTVDIGVHCSELSGGMQQRVGLARALATDADILLMDEPFSALDPLIRRKLQDELLALQERVKKTILFVSHDLDEALKLGDKVTILEGGRIVQTGTGRDIVEHPADDYVAEFVRHVNPRTAIKGAAPKS